MIPKNPGIAQKDTQKIREQPQKVPKILEHPRIMTYASYPPPPRLRYLDHLSPLFSLLTLFGLGGRGGGKMAKYLKNGLANLHET